MARNSHDEILDRIGRRIAVGDLASGAVITLAGLETDYGVSRTVIRETIRVLESIGMVRSKRRVGVTIQPAENWDTFDAHLIRWNITGPQRDAHLETLMELRAGVEPMAARLAALRASRAQADELHRLALEMEELGQHGLGASEEYLADDIAFHSLLLTASGNPMFQTLVNPVAATLRGRVDVGLMPAVPIEASLRGHVDIAQAIQARDAVAAAERTFHLLEAILREVVVEERDEG